MRALRWALAAIAAVGAFLGIFYVGLIASFTPFPRDLFEPVTGFFAGFFAGLAGALLAPHGRVRAAAILSLFAPLGSALLNISAPWALVGGASATTVIAWCFWPHRSRRSTMIGAWIGGAAIVCFVVLVYARYVDKPARPDDLPPELVSALGADASRVVAFHRYDLGGFIDHEWLWRIDADQRAVSAVVQGLGLERTTAVPAAFWRMPPHYWPRAMPARGSAFRSPEFPASGRGPDGDHHFVVHDVSRGSAFVWVKSNF